MELDKIRSAVDDLISALSVIQDKLSNEASMSDDSETSDFSYEFDGFRFDLNDVFVFSDTFSLWEIAEEYYKPDTNCKKCRDGYIPVPQDSFCTHSIRCSCQNYSVRYVPKEIKLKSIIRRDDSFIYVGADRTYYNMDNVRTNFDPDYPIGTLYRSEEECRKACEYFGNKE